MNLNEDNECIYQEKYENYLNLVSETLMQFYLENEKNNREAVLDEEESKILDSTTDFLNNIIQSYNENENNETKIDFNVNNFKSFIKKVYIVEEIKPDERVQELGPEQSGGTRTFGYGLGFFRRRRNNENHYEQDTYDDYPPDPSDPTDWRTEYDSLPELPTTIFEAYPQRQQRRKYDFMALISFFVAIILIYISYTKYNEISNKIFDKSLMDATSDVSITFYNQINTALDDVRQLSSIELTFVQYVWKSISTFSCSIVQQQTTLITNIVFETAQNCINNFTEIATKQAQLICSPRTQVLSETDFGEIGRLFNDLTRIVSSAISIEDTNICIVRQTGTEIERYISNMNYNRNTLMNEISTLSSQAMGFLSWGARIGYPSTMYLTYRIYYLIQQRMLFLRDRSRNRRGGKKYTKKQRKQNKSKKSKKSKKQRKHNKSKKSKQSKKSKKH